MDNYDNVYYEGGRHHDKKISSSTWKMVAVLFGVLLVLILIVFMTRKEQYVGRVGGEADRLFGVIPRV